MKMVFNSFYSIDVEFTSFSLFDFNQLALTFRIIDFSLSVWFWKILFCCPLAEIFSRSFMQFFINPFIF